MARILCVGIATLDLVFTVDHYPREDEEMRAQSLRVTRGGNAANTAVVLARLGHQVAFAGVLAAAEETAILVRDFQQHGVDTAPCVVRPGKPPTSSILLAPSGSRTIVHYRDLSEFGCEDFARLDLAAYDWVHFEGRNPDTLACMLDHLRRHHARLPLSLEAEKPRPGLAALFDRCNVLLTGRAFARALGHGEPRAFLQALRAQAPRPLIFAGWGETGAWALPGSEAPLYTPAFPPPRVVDTVGAGDTFNAGVIHGVLNGWPVDRTLREAASLAGRKCGQVGFSLVPTPGP
ncbi:PfkB family carbohydrate kinase [Thiobacter aerophilum]|uniref:PfkB family carbohydrate kinase n=1 Tax=Thiobacter aerophilum TaxID=3121275 RepID=A0ABV0EHN8_9BURK